VYKNNTYDQPNALISQRTTAQCMNNNVRNRNILDNRTVTSGSINIFKGNLERLRQSKEIDLFCWQLMLLDLPRLNRAVGEALSGKLSGKLSYLLERQMHVIAL